MNAGVATAWKRKYRLDCRPVPHALKAVGFGVFVWLFLFVFQPFGLSTYPGSIALFTAGYGAVTTLLMAFLNVALPLVLRRFFDEEQWTVGREVLWTLANVVIIALGNVAYTQWALGGSIGISGAASMVLYTVAVALIPVTVGILLSERSQRMKYLLASEGINQSLKTAPHHDAMANELVEIPLQTAEGTLPIRPSDLLFVKAEENYCQLTFVRSTGLSMRLVRTPLSAVEEAFEAHPAMRRVHRSYLVNLRHVKDLSGNAQGFRLHFNEGNASVPVSRKLNEEIRDLVAQFR